MPTPHISAPKGAFAKVVLMPGDSYRARWIAETFLKDIQLVTEIRGIFGYTGYTKNGKKISVMASGMGLPSIGIYSHELFTEYGVETIIRVGTCGSYHKDVPVGSIVIGQAASTNSNWMAEYDLHGTYSACSSFPVLRAAVEEAEKLGLEYHVGNILSSDIFYERGAHLWKRWADLGVLAVEMEAYALYEQAASLHKQALAICTCSDSFVDSKILTANERQTGLSAMIELGIAVAEHFAE